jgi:hypothetical protein
MIVFMVLCEIFPITHKLRLQLDKLLLILKYFDEIYSFRIYQRELQDLPRRGLSGRSFAVVERC